MKLCDLFEKYTLDSDARSFGLWIFRNFEKLHPEININNIVLNCDWDDDRNKPLRYRILCRKRFVDYIGEIKEQISERGWHLTVCNRRKTNLYQLVFEPILSSRQKRSAIFWHVTPEQNIDSILSNGLIPQNSRFKINYPQPRIYLLKNKNDAERMIKLLQEKDNKKYVLLKIDLRNKSNITVHTDPELSNVAVYTIQAIPSNQISLTSK